MPNNEQKITLGVLNAIHDNSSITQRSMAGELGIALGLTNSYLMRCVKKIQLKLSKLQLIVMPITSHRKVFLTNRGLHANI